MRLDFFDDTLESIRHFRESTSLKSISRYNFSSEFPTRDAVVRFGAFSLVLNT